MEKPFSSRLVTKYHLFLTFGFSVFEVLYLVALGDLCCIFWPAVRCYTLQMLVKILIFCVVACFVKILMQNKKMRQKGHNFTLFPNADNILFVSESMLWDLRFFEGNKGKTSAWVQAPQKYVFCLILPLFACFHVLFYIFLVQKHISTSV